MTILRFTPPQRDPSKLPQAGFAQIVGLPVIPIRRIKIVEPPCDCEVRLGDDGFILVDEVSVP